MPNSRRLFSSVVAFLFLSSAVIGVAPVGAQATTDTSRVAATASSSPERLVAEVAIPKGAMVNPGRKRRVIVEVHNVGMAPAVKAGVMVKAPEGVRVTTKTKRWTCDVKVVNGETLCRHEGTIAGNTSEELELILRTTKETPPSQSELKITPFTSSTKAIVTKSSPFTVHDLGDPVMVPHVQHRNDAKNEWVEWTDGEIQEAYVNENYTYRVRVRNEGVVAFPDGEDVRLYQRVGKGVEFESARIVGATGKCNVYARVLRCTFTSTKEVAPQKILGAIDVTIKTHKAQERLPLGPIKLYEPLDKGRRHTSVVMTGVHRPDALTIETHPGIDADAGGQGSFTVRLDNGDNGIVHDSYTVRTKMPAKLRFVRVAGKNWSCAMDNGFLECIYESEIQPGQRSSLATITYRALRSARVGEPGYSLEFRSAHAVAFMHVLVRPSLTVTAEASHDVVRTSFNKKNNHVLLMGEITSDGGAHVRHRWVQRCTTLLDSRTYEDCTPGVVTPKAKIVHAGHSRTQAVLPHVTSKTEFIFEYIAVNESTEAHRTARVIALDAKPATSKAAVISAGEKVGRSPGTTSPFDRLTTTTDKKKSKSSSSTTPTPSVTTYANVVPEWIYTAFKNGHLDSSKLVSNNNVVSFSEEMKAVDVLTAAMRSRLVIDDSTPVYFHALADDPTQCAVLSIGSTAAVAEIGVITAIGMYTLHMDYVLPTEKCTYHDTTYTENYLLLTGLVFGDMKQYSGPVTWDPSFKYVGSISDSSWTIGNGKGAVTLRNVGMILTLDDATGSTTLGFNTGFAAFGTTLNLTGAITAPVSAGGVYTSGMEVSASLSSPAAFKDGPVTVRNLALTLALRWTPALSANRAWNDSALADVWFSVIGSGDVEFLGTTLRFDKIEADFLSGVLSRIQFTIKANMNIPGMKEAKGDITIVWMAGFPANPTNTDLLGRADPVAATSPSWAVKASMIFQTENGFSIGTDKNPATLMYTGQCISISGQVIVPGVLDATVSGFLVTGFPCGAAYVNIGSALMKTQGHIPSILDTLPMPIAEGDWRFDATDVKINIAGTTVKGNFSIGRVLQAPFGAIDATLQLGKSATNNVIKVQGALNPMTGFTLKGNGNLEVAGMVLNFNVDAAMTITEQHIHATADLAIGGTTVALSGDFQYQKAGGVPIPTASFSADVKGLTIDGYGLGHASFSLTQGLGTGGVSASLDINLGFLKASGAASFHTVKNGIVMSIDAVGSLGVPDKFTADVSVHATNCATDACDSLGILKVKATGSVTLQKKDFNLASIEFDSAGHFKVTTRYSGESCDQSDNILGTEYRGCFEYKISALVSDSSPYVKFSADVELDVDARTRDTAKHKWNSWKEFLHFSSDIDVEFDPFKMSFRVGSIKVSFSGS